MTKFKAGDLIRLKGAKGPVFTFSHMNAHCNPNEMTVYQAIQFTVVVHHGFNPECFELVPTAEEVPATGGGVSTW